MNTFLLCGAVFVVALVLGWTLCYMANTKRWRRTELDEILAHLELLSVNQDRISHNTKNMVAWFKDVSAGQKKTMDGVAKHVSNMDLKFITATRNTAKNVELLLSRSDQMTDAILETARHTTSIQKSVEAIEERAKLAV